MCVVYSVYIYTHIMLRNNVCLPKVSVAYIDILYN